MTIKIDDDDDDDDDDDGHSQQVKLHCTLKKLYLVSWRVIYGKMRKSMTNDRRLLFRMVIMFMMV